MAKCIMSKKEEKEEKEKQQIINKDVKTLIEELTALSFINNSFNVRSDNWVVLSYDQRYLDAFARILHVHSDCAAIMKEITADKSTLGLAIAYNPLDKKEKGSNDKKVLEILKLESAINMTISDNHKPTDIKKLIIQALQYSENYSPSKIFGIKIDLAFIREYSNFHVKLKAAERGIEQKIQNKILLEEGEEAKHYEGQFVRYLEFIEGIKTLVKRVNHEESSSFVGSSLSSSSSEHNIYKEIYKVVIRPINDTLKLINYLKKKNIVEVKIDIMDNKADTHAETALKILCPEADYVGISKLSCVLCEAFLTSEAVSINHRGESGAFFASWGNLEQIEVTEEFKNWLKGVKDKLTEKYKSPEILQKELAIRYLNGNDMKNVRELLEKHGLLGALIKPAEAHSASGLSQYHDLSDDSDEDEMLIGQNSLYELKQLNDYSE